MAFIKKSTPFRRKRYHGCYEDFYTVRRYRNNIRDAIANIYDEMVVKFFINTIAKVHVKRLEVHSRRRRGGRGGGRPPIRFKTSKNIENLGK